MSNNQKKKQEQIFDKLFTSYRHRRYLTGWKRAYSKRIFKNMPIKEEGSLLDVGTGSGFMVMEAARFGMRSVGLDISKKSIELCRDLAKRELTADQLKRTKFVVGDAEKLPFKAKEFDRVVSIALLEHLENDKEAIAEIARVTKENAIVSICVPNTYERTSFLLKVLNRRNDKHVGHLRHYKAEDLIKEFKKNGFKLLDLTYHGHTIMILNWFINMTWSNPPGVIDKIWWAISNSDLKQKNKNNSMNFTITMKKVK